MKKIDKSFAPFIIVIVIVTIAILVFWFNKDTTLLNNAAHL